MPILIEGVLCKNKSGRSLGKTICVEQPEIHLHPKLQADFADFFIDSSINYGVQWILETHSEAIMLRIQKRIRSGVLDASAVSVIFVDPTCEGGSVISNIRLDSSGNFVDDFPGGFFEERFSELFE